MTPVRRIHTLAGASFHSRSGSYRIARNGQDNFDPRPMTSWERERMGAGFPDARRTAGTTFPLIAAVLGVLTIAWMIGRMLF